MLNPTSLVIDALVDETRTEYERVYGLQEPEFPSIIGFVARAALERIADSDAAYHDVRHTVMVTLAGQAILRGKHISEGGVTPRDWLNFTISLLCHDIGYVRGLCREDRDGKYVANESGDTISLPAGATDAALICQHVDRGKIFVRERFGGHGIIDVEAVCANIERTRFPIPDDEAYRRSDDLPGLARAADFVGQLADINHMRHLSALFAELHESGAAATFGFETAADLRAHYPKFYWEMVCPCLEPALKYLRVTQDGKQWLANLYSHLFAEEHALPCLGPEPCAESSKTQPDPLRAVAD